MSLRTWTARHDVILFLVLAYLFSWAIWPLMLLNPTSTPLVPFGPLIAALIVTVLVAGWPGVLGLVKQLGHWRVHPLWYATAILGPFALTALAAAVVVATGAPSPDWSVYADWSGLATTLLATALIIGVFEELGWRGFALPRMQRRHSALWAALVLGAVWALWHLPELVSDPGEREPVPYLIAVLAWSVIITWLYNSTRASLPVVILFHAAINTAAKFLMPELDAQYRTDAWWALAAGYALAAVAVIAFAGGRRLTTGSARRTGTADGGDARHRVRAGAQSRAAVSSPGRTNPLS